MSIAKTMKGATGKEVSYLHISSVPDPWQGLPQSQLEACLIGGV